MGLCGAAVLIGAHQDPEWFRVASWPHFYAEAFSCLRPGGWVENKEIDCAIVSDDDTLLEDSKLVEWARLWNQVDP